MEVGSHPVFDGIDRINGGNVSLNASPLLIATDGGKPVTSPCPDLRLIPHPTPPCSLMQIKRCYKETLDKVASAVLFGTKFQVLVKSMHTSQRNLPYSNEPLYAKRPTRAASELGGRLQQRQGYLTFVSFFA